MKQLEPTKLMVVKVPEDVTNIYNLSGNNYPVIGEVTREGIRFDVDPYMERVWSRDKTFYYDYTVIKDEKNIKINNWYKHTARESFYSLLQANNIEIPKGKKLLILLPATMK